MIFADSELARRLEGLESWAAAESGRARRRLWPDRDTAVVEVAGGAVCYLGEGSPLNEARGMGMNGPVSVEEIEAAEQVFFDRGEPARFNVASLAEPSILEGLATRGYRATGFENVLYRELDASEAAPIFPRPPGIAVAEVEPDQVEACGDLLARGFMAPEEPPPGMGDIFTTARAVDGMVGLMGRVDGEPAGAGCVLIRDGMAMLCIAATLPEFRNRGVQTALSHARLALAREAGCSLATIGTLPGTTSQRNAERLGFRIAYAKLILVRDRP
jgi:GNAT superfamily N-acetyltransferase